MEARSAEGEADLEQFACGEVLDKVAVSGEEVVGGQVFKLDPFELMEDAVFEFPTEFMHGEELQVDGTPVTVIVANVGDVAADFGRNAELLVQFTGEGLLRGFAGFDFPAWKLP